MAVQSKKSGKNYCSIEVASLIHFIDYWGAALFKKSIEFSTAMVFPGDKQLYQALSDKTDASDATLFVSSLLKICISSGPRANTTCEIIFFALPTINIDRREKSG